jgi:hypothetical protein
VHRLVAALAFLAFLTSSSVALADGAPGYVSLGGLGVLAPDGKTRYVAVLTTNSTAIERVRVAGGSIVGWMNLRGYWGIPAPAFSPAGGEGISRDGSKLFVATPGNASPTRFAIIDPRTMRVLDRFALQGRFAYDALSPDASTLYLVQHVDATDVSRYVVRAYDVDNHTLLPGRIADKTQRDWVMAGTPLTRATSSDGRWVYTLYQSPGGYPFVHALDTVSGVAHCTGLPWTGDQTPMWNVRLSLVDDGKTLSVHWKSGRPWLTMNTHTWRLVHVHPGGAFPWRWVLGGAGGAAVVLLAFAAVVLARRRHPREAVPAAL